MMSMNLSDIAILAINSADYACIISGISKSDKYQFDRKKWNIMKHKNHIQNYHILSHIKLVKKF